MVTERKSSFPPVYASDARLLLLGSLPGEASLAATRYYAHPQNQFWRLMGEVLELDLCTLDYDARLAALTTHKVALWDVVESAERQGSLDTAIRNVHANDLLDLIGALPDLKLIAFNGKRAASIGTRILKDTVIPTVTLPSSSPAFTLAYADKLTDWLALRTALDDEAGEATPAT